MLLSSSQSHLRGRDVSRRIQISLHVSRTLLYLLCQQDVYIIRSCSIPFPRYSSWTLFRVSQGFTASQDPTHDELRSFCGGYHEKRSVQGDGYKCRDQKPERGLGWISKGRPTAGRCGIKFLHVLCCSQLQFSPRGTFINLQILSEKYINQAANVETFALQLLKHPFNTTSQALFTTQTLILQNAAHQNYRSFPSLLHLFSRSPSHEANSSHRLLRHVQYQLGCVNSDQRCPCLHWWPLPITCSRYHRRFPRIFHHFCYQ